jgi:hypothetical protein
MAETLYLVHAGGDAYQAEIVPESRLDDAYLLTQWGTLVDINPEQRADALAYFNDDDSWAHEEPSGRGARIRFFENFEDGWVEVVRLPTAAPAQQAEPALELAAALGWPSGISEPAPWSELLCEVARLRVAQQAPSMTVGEREEPAKFVLQFGRGSDVRLVAAEIMREALKRSGMKRKEVASLLGISEAAMSLKLNGDTNHTLTSIDAFCGTVGVELTFRLGGEHA